MPAAQKLRVGLIGFGLGGASFHAPLIAATDGMALATVVTANSERKAQALRDYPGVHVAADADWLWRHAGDHDLVVISTPNGSHVKLALAALDAGLPVVIDKPFAATVADAKRVLDLAKARRLAVSAYHIRRWDSECLTLQDLMAKGALGKVLRFESRLERWRPEAKGGWKERGAPEEAGGLLYDIGSHLIDQALYLFGPVSTVYAERDIRRKGVQADDDVFVALTHVSGVRSHLWASCLAATPAARMRVMGDRGAFVKLQGDMQEAALRNGARPSGAGWGEEPEERWGFLNDGVRDQSVPSRPGAYQKFYARMRDTLLDGAPVPVSGEDILAGLQIIEAAQRSAAERRVIALESGSRSR
ncbi:MAG TPA: Gfo/Idh/MocA family oxidoreductase [Rhizomicrobium sp.]|nr:Gfo/Idh/MocA family oxidoreductase [Rhizomicrobium sp.]